MYATTVAQLGIAPAFGVSFTVLMAVAAGWDVRCRRIPNALTLAIALLGAAFVAISADPTHAMLRAAAGIATALGLWLPLWLLRLMGAGDVKFFAAASSWLGPRLALDATVASALAGGVLALCWMLWHGRAQGTATSREGDTGVEAGAVGSVAAIGARDAAVYRATLPYGVAMAAGLTITAWVSHVFR